MPSLPPGYNTKELEKGVTNKWSWGWLSEVDDNGDKWGIWLEKPNTPGVAKCGACDSNIKYGSSGKKAIKSHSRKKDHQNAVRAIRTNQVRSICWYFTMFHQGGWGIITTLTGIFLYQALIYYIFHNQPHVNIKFYDENDVRCEEGPGKGAIPPPYHPPSQSF